MSRNCPHCGTALPSVRDAFCIECGGSLDEAESAGRPSGHDSYEGLQNEIVGSLHRFTFMGRLVILIYVLVAIGGTVGTIAYLFEGLPPGLYQIFYFVAPWALGSILLCALTLHLLNRQGVRVYHEPIDSERRKQS